MFGVDALGGKHYQRDLLKALKPGTAVGIFLRTFGDARKTVEALAKSGKVAEIVVHLAPFDARPGHPYPKRLTTQMRRDAKWLNTIAEKYQHCEIMISPFCEHPHGLAVMRPIFDQLLQLAPFCTPLNSVLRDGQECPGTITEIHLENSKPRKKPKGPYTVSFDGFGGNGSGDFPDADVPSILARYADARHVRAWNFRFNGKHSHDDRTPIARRKSWPDHRYIRGTLATLKQREGAVTWSAHQLYKSFADDHGKGGKDNKALCIMQTPKNQLRVFDRAGNLIDTLTRFGDDHAGKPRGGRFYSGKYAYEIGDIAEKNTGSRLIRVENSALTDADLRSNLWR